MSRSRLQCAGVFRRLGCTGRNPRYPLSNPTHPTLSLLSPPHPTPPRPQVDHFPGQSEPCDPSISPEGVTHLSQNRLIPLLRERAEAAGGAVRFGQAVDQVRMQGCQLPAATSLDDALGTLATHDPRTPP